MTDFEVVNPPVEVEVVTVVSYHPRVGVPAV